MDTVTGSKLQTQFRKTRLSISLLIALLLAPILALSGLNVYLATKVNLDIQKDRQQSTILQKVVPFSEEFFTEQEMVRQNILREVGQKVILGQSLIFVYLMLLSWFSLYFLLKPLSDSQVLKEKFLAQASHELRTPLAILYSELSLNKNAKSVSEFKSVFQEAVVEIKRLQNLSDTLLSQLDGQKQVEEFFKINPYKMTNEIIVKLGILNNKSLIFKNKIPQRLNLNSNVSKFYQLWFNLLDNTLKYSDPKSAVLIEYDKELKRFKLTNQTRVKQIQPGVGLQICKELSDQLGYHFVYQVSDNKCVVSISLA
jgi:signal transduction histidine kinase